MVDKRNKGSKANESFTENQVTIDSGSLNEQYDAATQHEVKEIIVRQTSGVRCRLGMEESENDRNRGKEKDSHRNICWYHTLSRKPLQIFCLLSFTHRKDYMLQSLSWSLSNSLLLSD